MNRTDAKTWIDSWMDAMARLPRTPMLAGAGGGFVAGIGLGSIVGLEGVIAGTVIGIAVGFIAGLVTAHDDEVTSTRTGELDAIIGITRGSMGAGPIDTSRIVEEDDEEPNPLSTKEAWLAEWLTPPPPNVAG
jgi:hypothetical protein